MEISGSLRVRLLQGIVNFVTIVAMLVCGFVRAIHPSLHMDESLYLGASLRMLHGDPLLTTYWLDKTPWSSILMIPGILVAGENSLGFHLSGLICGILAVLVGQSIVREILGRSVWACLAQLFYLGVNLFPFMVFHHASAFTDPFLILFLLLFLRSIWRSLDHGRGSANHAFEDKAYIYFTLALLAKFSAFMWAPVLVGFWVLTYGRDWLKQGPKRFWHAGRYLWLGAFFYMLTNPGKLAPIAWFSALFPKASAAGRGGPGLNFWQRVFGWTDLAGQLFESPLLSGFLAALAVLISVGALLPLIRYVKEYRPKSLDRWYALLQQASPTWSRFFLLLVVPFWAHALGLCLSGASLFPRYLFILIPQLLLLVIVGLHLAAKESKGFGNRKAWVARRLAQGGALAILVVTASAFSRGFDLHRQWDFVTESSNSPRNARMLYTVRDEIPRGSVLHHESRLWYLFPFMRGTELRAACQRPECLSETQKGRTPFDRQYLLAESTDHRFWDLRHVIPKHADRQPSRVQTVTTDPLRIDLQDFLNEQTTRQALRLFGWAKELNWIPASCLGCEPNSQGVTPALPDWAEAATLPGAPADLVVQMQKTDRSYLPSSLKISGQLVLTRGKVANPSSFEQRWYLAYRLESIRPDGWDINLVDLAPIIFGSYTVSLGAVDLAEARDGQFSSIRDLRWDPAAPRLSLVGTMQHTTSTM